MEREEPRLDLVVAGHTNIDRFLFAEKLPEADRTVPLRGQRVALGGTAATLARQAARAGVHTGLISRIGPDFPESFLVELRRDGVDLTGLERVPDTQSPTCYIVEDGRGHQVTFIHQGPMEQVRGALLPEAVLGTTRWLHLTTGAPAWQLALKSAARAFGVRVAVDPAQELHYLWDAAHLSALLSGAEMLFGNASEIKRVLALLRLRDITALLARVPLVVMTQGARGVVAYSRAGTLRVPAQRVASATQVTGAGDSFRGGFYGAFFAGQPLREALEEGTRTAAAWMRQRPPTAARAGRTTNAEHASR